MAEATTIKEETDLETSLDSVNPEMQTLMARVGDRVRKAREMKGIPRRVLSETSGVSPRYLAQLEAGAGNISIGLLQRVAAALDHKIEWLVGEEDPWTSDALRVARMYRVASEETKKKVMCVLTPEIAGAQRAQRICLVGLRGAGKSTLGEQAGKSLSVPFLELNRDIEEQSGMPIDEVMALYGFDGYRKLEAQAVSRVIENHDRVILAAAGGIVADPDTYGNLLNHFHTIWVKTSPEEHMSRVREQGDERPMAGNSAAMEQLKSILSSREPLYERALEHLDTAQKPVDASLNELLEIIESHGFLE